MLFTCTILQQNCNFEEICEKVTFVDQQLSSLLAGTTQLKNLGFVLKKIVQGKKWGYFVSISSIRYVSEVCQMYSDNGCLFVMGVFWWVPLGKVSFGGFLWERSFLEKSFMEG